MNLVKFNFDNGDFQYSLYFQKHLTAQIGKPTPFINNEHHEYSQFFDVINQLVAKGKTILDIGAHCGLVSIPLAIYGYDIIAFEPVKSNIDCLIKGIEDNKIENIKISTCAVSDKTEDTKIYVPKSEDCSSLKLSALEVLKDKSFVVENIKSITIDDYVQNEKIDAKKIGAIKIDVQGLEMNVIKGMINTLQDVDDVLFIIEWDYSHSGGKSLDEIIDILKRLSIIELKREDILLSTGLKLYLGNKIFKKIKN